MYRKGLLLFEDRILRPAIKRFINADIGLLNSTLGIFVPWCQNVKASDLTAVFTGTFPNLEMHKSFYNIYHDVDTRWSFHPLYMQATLTF